MGFIVLLSFVFAADYIWRKASSELVPPHDRFYDPASFGVSHLCWRLFRFV